jgi:protein-tyrosine-phosphatase/predicted ATP-grasp superfamily ATP-dependent carboligase
MAKGNVLVLGDDTRSFLAIVRSLGRHGLKVHVAPQNWRSAALRSRYIDQRHVLPMPIGRGDAWLASLENLLRREHFDLTVPCSDRFLLPLHAHRHHLAGLTRLALPKPEHIEILFDKVRTRQLAASLGIGLAKGLYPEHPVEADQVFAQLGAPVVVKPRRSLDPQFLERQEQVQIVATPEDLRSAITDREPGSHFFEAFFPGFGLGVSVLAERGAVLQAFQHHRVHQAARGGSSAYRVSAPLSPDLHAACEKIVGCLNYTGVAMFEFRRSADSKDWVLLEVNARPWGSMPLPVALGVDFPFAWHQLLTSAARIPTQAYRTGIYARNFELDIAFAAKHLAEVKGQHRRVAFLARWFLGFGRVLIGREKIDTLAIDDPAPAIAECRSLASRLVRRTYECVPGHRVIRRASARTRLRRALAQVVRTGGTPSIVFVCYGNICRSAFAERLLGRTLAPLAGQVLVKSAGTYQVEGRSSPSEAVQAARRHGMDLMTHRSQSITREILDAATVIIVFDRSNVETLNSQFPGISSPIIPLGFLTITGNRGGNIHDPYGGEPAIFDRTFALIEQGVAVLRAQIFDIIAAKPVT